MDRKPIITLTVNKADDAPYIRELNSYVQNQYTIFEKLGVRSRAEAVVEARRLKLINSSDFM